MFLIDNETEPPVSDQFNAGVRTSVRGILVRPTTPASAAATASLTCSATGPNGTCCLPIPGFSNVLISSDAKKTWFDAMYLTAERPFRRRWGFSVELHAGKGGGDRRRSVQPRLPHGGRLSAPSDLHRRAPPRGHDRHRRPAVRLPRQRVRDARVRPTASRSSTTPAAPRSTGAASCFGGRPADDFISLCNYQSVDMRVEKIFRLPARTGVDGIRRFNIFSTTISGGYNGIIPVLPLNPNFGVPSSRSTPGAGGCSSACDTRSRGEGGFHAPGVKGPPSTAHETDATGRRGERLCAGLRPHLVGLSRGRPSSAIEQRIDALLSQMTLEEKLGQLQQLDGHADGRFRDEHLELARKGLLGSTLNVRGAAQVNALQRAAVEGSRLKIPLIFAFDVIHGYRTVFPIPLGEAASWDPAAAERSASIAAAETRAAGVHWTFAPMVDIARDARWGRIAEGAGEDPFLGAAMATARVRGFQGDDYSRPDKVVACAKHWVAYGAAEAGRDYNSVDMSEHTLRSIFFPPFKAAVDAGVGTFMSAFNDLNGVPTSGNHFTLTQVLRGEWKFDGLVVSDYNSVIELIKHGFAADQADAARLALTAGVDMEMISRSYVTHGPQHVKDKKVALAVVDEAVRRVLRIKLRAGIFERPYADADDEKRAMLTPDLGRRPARSLRGRWCCSRTTGCCLFPPACAGLPSSVRSPTIGRT